jgi:hypothetical protein
MEVVLHSSLSFVDVLLRDHPGELVSLEITRRSTRRTILMAYVVTPFQTAKIRITMMLFKMKGRIYPDTLSTKNVLLLNYTYCNFIREQT